MTGFGQDVILFHNGDKQDVKVLEITPEVIKYNKFNSTSKVIYTENKYNLIGVIFEDGEFQKFENRRGGSSILGDYDLGDHGSHMIFVEPLAPLVGILGVGYEYFAVNGKSSIVIPFRVQILDNDLTEGFISTGFEHSFFPTGSGGVVRGFLGYAEHIGTITLRESYYYYYYDSWTGYDESYLTWENNTYFFNETKFIGGVQFNPSTLINITLKAGLGVGLLDFDDLYLAWDLGLKLGFRF